MNVLKAIATANKYNITTIGLTGKDGRRMNLGCEFLFNAPFLETQKIQEWHMQIGHEFCAIIEREMFPQ